jgi:hypothetical protein
MKRAFLLGVVALLCALASSASASAGTTTVNVFFDEVVPFDDPCTGESLVFTVSAHILLHVTTDADGGTHVHDHANGQRAFAVGPTGVLYQGKIVDNILTQDNGPNGQMEFTDVFHFRVQSQGDSDNFTLEFRVHFTVNANGEVTATFFDSSFECSG